MANEKIYVQDRMREVGRDLWSWLADGAHVYVCGDAKRMAEGRRDAHSSTLSRSMVRAARRTRQLLSPTLRRRAATSRTCIDECAGRITRRPCALLVPTAGWAAASSSAGRPRGAADQLAIPNIRRISAGSAPRARRLEKHSASAIGCCIRCCGQ